MDYIGFEKGDTVVYEGDLHTGYRAQPRPLLTPIEFPDFRSGTDLGSVAGIAQTIFREDSFDPATRIRRGRVFTLYGDHFPRDWQVHDPLRKDLPHVDSGRGLMQRVRVFLYSPDPLITLRKNLDRSPRITALLGKEPFVTIWTAISFEDSVIGPPVLTLRLQRSLSGLPEIDFHRFDEPFRSRLRDAIEALENSNHRLGAVDVIDRSRAVLCLLFGFRTENFGADLARLVGIVRKEKSPRNLACWAADTVNRLHSRGKPNEQHTHGTRSIDEDDAQLAVGCVGLVVKEFGFDLNSS